MSRQTHRARIRGAFPPRTVAFCRGAMSVVLAALGMTALVLMLVALVTLQTMRPSFGQAPAGPAAVHQAGDLASAPVYRPQ